MPRTPNHPCSRCGRRARWSVLPPFSDDFEYACSTHLGTVLAGLDMRVGFADSADVVRLW